MATKKGNNKQQEQAVVTKASVPVWQFILVLLFGVGLAGCLDMSRGVMMRW